VQLWPGDELSWSCTFNTSTTNRTVMGACLELQLVHTLQPTVVLKTAHPSPWMPACLTCVVLLTEARC
jgi:hypothetical protein